MLLYCTFVFLLLKTVQFMYYVQAHPDYILRHLAAQGICELQEDVWLSKGRSVIYYYCLPRLHNITDTSCYFPS